MSDDEKRHGMAEEGRQADATQDAGATEAGTASPTQGVHGASDAHDAAGGSESASKAQTTGNGTDTHASADKPSDSPTAAESGNCGCDNDSCQCGDDGQRRTAQPAPGTPDGDRLPRTDGDARCGCAKPRGRKEARRPRKGHDTLAIALGIVGVVLGASALVIACDAANEVASVKSEVADAKSGSGVDGQSPLDLLVDEDAYDRWLERHGLSLEDGTRVGFIGVRVQDPTSGTKGAEVVGVSAGAPAEDADIERGDVITSFGGKDVTSADGLVDLVRDAEIGSTQEVTVVRDGETKTLSVTVGSTIGGTNERNGENESANGDGDGHGGGSTLDGGGDLKSN